MKGISTNKYKFHLGIRNHDTAVNEIKVSELKLNYHYHLLPIIDSHKEKKFIINCSDSNNAVNNLENKQGKLSSMRKSSKKNVLLSKKKEVEGPFEISIENFKDKIFNKKKSKYSSNDVSIFEDASGGNAGRKINRKKSDEFNFIRQRNPILWFKNPDKKTSTSDLKNIKIPSGKINHDDYSDLKHENLKTIILQDTKAQNPKSIFERRITVLKENLKIEETTTAKFIQTNIKLEKIVNLNTHDISNLVWKQADILEQTEDYLLHTALNLANGARILVKKYNQKELCLKELEVTKYLNHCNILKHFSSDDLCIYSEYPGDGSLKEKIKTFRKLNENIIRKVIKQIFNAINYLHTQGIVHLNITSANIFMDSDGTAKITNFNQSKCVLIKSGYFNDSENSYRLDLLSVSLLIIEMYTGELQLNFHNDVERIYEFIDFSVNNIEGLSSDIRSFLTNLKNFNPCEKLNINYLINHPFLS